MAKSNPNGQMVKPCPSDQTWIEVQLLDEDGNPVPQEKYRITLPDGSVQQGALDAQGKVRFDGIVAGNAEVTFLEIDAREWKGG